MPAKATLIETLGPDHSALVLFDTLHGYLHPKDPKKQAFLKENNILPNLTKLLKGARRAGLRTFYPSGDHAADGSDISVRLTDTDMDLRPWPKGPLAAAQRIHFMEQTANWSDKLTLLRGTNLAALD